MEEWTDLGAELGQLVGLSVEPAEGLHVLQGGAGSGTGGRGAQSNGCIIHILSTCRTSILGFNSTNVCTSTM